MEFLVKKNFSRESVADHKNVLRGVAGQPINIAMRSDEIVLKKAGLIDEMPPVKMEEQRSASKKPQVHPHYRKPDAIPQEQDKGAVDRVIAATEATFKQRAQQRKETMAAVGARQDGVKEMETFSGSLARSAAPSKKGHGR